MSSTATRVPPPILCCAISPILYNWCLLSLSELLTFSVGGDPQASTKFKEYNE